MRALIYRAPGTMQVEEWPRSCLAPDEEELAVAAAGICGADLAGFLGRSRRRTPPLILGHEFVGYTSGGRRVVADPLITCGNCPECRSGRENLCSGLRLLGMDPLAGCFAEFVVVPKRQIYEIPGELGDARAILAEPLANIVHLFRLAAPEPGFRMGIVGAGTMGSMALQLARQMGAGDVVVEEADGARLAAARQMGATLAVHSERQRGETRSFAHHGPGLELDLELDLVLDACGTAAARQRAFNLCRPGGTVVLLGLADACSTLDFAVSIRREQRALMSFGYTPADFRRSLDLLAEGAVDLTPWTVEMPLEDGQKAFETMSATRGNTLKTMLRVR